MNKETRLAIIDDRLDVGLDILRSMSPGNERFIEVANYLNLLVALRDRVECFGETITLDKPEPAEEQIVETVETVAEALAQPKPEPEPARDDVPEAPVATITKAEMVSKLQRLQNAGLNLEQLFRDVGPYERLSAIPPERYAEVLAEAEKRVSDNAAN